MPRLENGDTFPDVRAEALDEEGPVRLPDDFRGGPTLLLFYRGHW